MKFNSKVLAYHVQGPGFKQEWEGKREKGREEKRAKGGREESREHAVI